MSATPCSRAGSVTARTSASGSSRSTISTIVSGGVSAPRNVIRQPSSRSERPKITSPRSCRSPGGQASTARRPAAAVPAARKAEQATAEQVRGEVLLRDGDLAALPTRAELVQKRQDDAGEHGSRGVVGQKAVERGMSGGVVELLEGAAELGSDAAAGATSARAGGSERGLPGRLGRREPRSEQLPHSSHPLDVVLRVEPVAAGGALRREQAVAPLPRPQELRRDAGATRELADPQLCCSFHVDIVQTLDRDLTAGILMR